MTNHTSFNAEKAIVLPASADDANRPLVDRTVRQIREILAKTISRGLDEIGRLLLREFFDDEPALYFSASPSKHASLNLLVERCQSIDLPVSRTFLANALRLAAVSKQLPRSAKFLQLPPSHRVELLRVREPDELEELAAKTLAKKLSVQKLRLLVRKNEGRKSDSTPGRKRRAEALRAVERCLRSLRNEDTGKLLFHRSDIAEMTEEQQAQLATGVASLAKRVAELQRILVLE
jgi:hypothetical protein